MEKKKKRKHQSLRDIDILYLSPLGVKRTKEVSIKDKKKFSPDCTFLPKGEEYIFFGILPCGLGVLKAEPENVNGHVYFIPEQALSLKTWQVCDEDEKFLYLAKNALKEWENKKGK